MEKVKDLYILVHQILKEYIPHIDAIVHKYKHNINQIAIFLYYNKAIEKFQKILNHLYEIFLKQMKPKKKEKKKNSFFSEIEEKLIFKEFNFFDLEDINIKTTLELLEKMKEIIFLPILAIIQKKGENELIILKTILISTRKLDFLLDYIEEVITYPKNDLFGISEENRKNHKTWQEFSHRYKTVKTGSKKDLEEGSEKNNKIFFAVQAAYIKSRKSLLNLENHKSLLDILKTEENEFFLESKKSLKTNKNKKKTKSVINRKFWTNTFHYLMNSKSEDSKLVVELFNAFPKINIVQEIWNLTEVKLIKTMRKMTLIKIGTNCKFYIYPEIFHSFFPNKEKTSKFSKNVYISKEKVLNLDLSALVDNNLFRDDKDKISIRLLFPSKIDVKGLVKSKLAENLVRNKSKVKKNGFFSSMKKILRKNKSEKSFMEKIEKSVNNNSFTSSRESSFMKVKEKNDILNTDVKNNINFDDNDNANANDNDNNNIKEDKTLKSNEINNISQNNNTSINKKKTNSPKPKKPKNPKTSKKPKESPFISPETSKKFKNIIIHIHGGGFISSSSSYHQRNLKRLPNKNLKHPIGANIRNRLPTSTPLKIPNRPRRLHSRPLLDPANSPAPHKPKSRKIHPNRRQLRRKPSNSPNILPNREQPPTPLFHLSLLPSAPTAIPLIHTLNAIFIR